MVQKSNYPNTETELQTLQDNLYQIAKDARNNQKRPAFKGMMEWITSETVITTAIHNIKSNKGSRTAGTDREIINKYLEQPYQKTIREVQEYAKRYNPKLIRRVWIEKAGKQELRPLGIPTIMDRILQECIRIIIEPICEAQFFAHSYGFRPMRNPQQALERLTSIVHRTGYHWIIEGDISKYFNTIHHRTLLKRLWAIGIRDRRLLQIIKEMLKTGIMEETAINELGTQQGGILSPLLANVYLDIFDEWVDKQWGNKRTKHSYTLHENKRRALKTTNIRPSYLIRFADDWVLVTDTKKHAEEWKERIACFLKTKLRLTLSDEKTTITNVKTGKVKFLGFEYKIVKGKSQQGYITRTTPNKERIKLKIKELIKKIKSKKKRTSVEEIIHHIQDINSVIRGIIQYYQAATWVNIELAKHAQKLRWVGYRSMKKMYPTNWIPADKVHNLHSVHERYTTALPTIEYKGLNIGMTNLAFCKWEKTKLKNQQETPYSQEGRATYGIMTGKKPIKLRADELLTLHMSNLIARGLTEGKYNFEYYMNRAYAFNRDRGRCRISGLNLLPHEVHIHHIQPHLPIHLVNKVSNLATVHKDFHKAIHNAANYSHLGTKIWRKIEVFREKLTK